MLLFKSLIKIYIKDYKMLTLLHSLPKEKLSNVLDKKNKQLMNLALLPGFNFEDLKNSSKRHNIYECNYSLNNTTDKNVISDKTFSNFYKVIDSSQKKQTKKRKQREKKLTRKM